MDIKYNYNWWNHKLQSRNVDHKQQVVKIKEFFCFDPMKIKSNDWNEEIMFQNWNPIKIKRHNNTNTH